MAPGEGGFLRTPLRQDRVQRALFVASLGPGAAPGVRNGYWRGGDKDGEGTRR